MDGKCFFILVVSNLPLGLAYSNSFTVIGAPRETSQLVMVWYVTS